MDPFINISEKKQKRHWDGMITNLKVRRRTTGALDHPSWSQLPLELQLHILNFLPLPALCRGKSVCKAWKSAIQGLGYSKAHRFCNGQWYIMDGFCSVGLCDGNSRPLSWKMIEMFTTMETASICVSSAGLVLAYFPLNTLGTAVVCNPLDLSSLVKLPPPPGSEPTIIFVAIQSSVGSDNRPWFSVVSVQGIKTTYVGARHLVLQVYDSRVHKWVSSCRVFANGNEIAQTSFDDANDCMLLREDKLYFITIAKNNTRSLKCVNVWDSDGKVATVATWTSLPMGLHQEPYNGCRNNNTSLVYCAGKLVLANFILDAQTLGFVYLDEASRQWRPLATMPREILPANLRKVGPLASNMHEWSLVVAGGETEITFLILHFEGCSGGIYNEVTDIWRTAFDQRGGALYPFKPSFNPL
ncbi:hypothetical protein SELMODRAFT_406709 [Selaginella moellendorffii]|uniref:F-box domain-containing protein n=1 Tax=Selaginella moellendorffii TaxID=88036 RepID=D8R178_SELML|nr:uncharacterized protein LOC9659424 [Selaginella moellendorffii]EFJ34220.1 hypothetical protein SELMODRAFT_406709 [Selaginella moellendorffii]|eukprot:XP_002965382.1 uncharacterized protein LOC9659424 [Selaginella moellendorffii]